MELGTLFDQDQDVTRQEEVDLCESHGLGWEHANPSSFDVERKRRKLVSPGLSTRMSTLR